RIVLFGLLASIAIGVAGVFMAEQLDSTFENSEEVEGFAPLPVLSAIPPIPTKLSRIARENLKPLNGNSGAILLETNERDGFSPMQMRQFQRHRLAVLSDPHSIAGQQFGILALKIERRMRETGKQVLAIASATGEDGKSVTALNVSLAMAESLRGRVVLVDCDMRLPQLHRRLDLPASPGFSDLLRDSKCTISACRTRVGNLDVIPGGSRTVNPAALLSSTRASEVIDRLRKEYELIVLDSPPLIAIADGQLMADLSDAALLVVRARRTPAQLVQRCIDNVGAEKLLGVVLNGAEYAGSAYAQAYRHYQKHYLSRV
ncbi:MAG: CpsD/CapB family tyrosine-protein kinase, partial [Bryobacterales bacterium]|nr:CpsD/CapB family tyrosine-protein kinase [Bryobacterales bacterium]